MREDTRDRHFARDGQGREVFIAPYGRCYVVPDAETRARLQRIVRRSPWLIAIAVSSIATPLAIHRQPWYWIFLGMPLVAALDLIPVYRATRGLEVAHLARSSEELQRDIAHSMSTASLWAYEALTLAAVLFAAPFLARHGQTSLAWALGVFSAAAAIAFAWLLWQRSR